VVATGYLKAAFHRRTDTRVEFPEARPIVLYTPHWQRRRSSWWAWGAEILEKLLRDGRYNVIFAPHQRLVERAPELRHLVRRLSGFPHLHCDLDGFAMVDGSYTEISDIYLGDTSSQVVEFLTRPRPCVFLNPDQVDWRRDESYSQWTCGEVVEDLDELTPALARAPDAHDRFRPLQVEFAATRLGDLSGESARPVRFGDCSMRPPQPRT
jgi:CDP-glycerol glycerophosphotransferase (TagB/SpsB family)